MAQIKVDPITGAQISHGRETGSQSQSCVLSPIDCRHCRLFVLLSVVVISQVRVRVDQTWKDSCAAQIDHLCAGGNRQAAANRSNAITVDEDHRIGDETGALAVKELAASNCELFGRGLTLRFNPRLPAVLNNEPLGLNKNADRENGEYKQVLSHTTTPFVRGGDVVNISSSAGVC